MNSKDFSFLYRKEILILGCFLLALTFALIAVEQQSRLSSITPLLILNLSLLDILGLFLPIITLIVLFFRIPSRRNFSRNFLKSTLGVRILFLLSFLFLFSLFIVFILSFPMAIPPGSPLPTPSTSEMSTTTFPPPPPPLFSFYSYLLGVFENFRTVFLIIVLFLMLLPLVIILIRRGKQKVAVLDISDGDGQEDQKTQAALNILEYYYRASEVLEKEGADASPCLTPTEFTVDVYAKNLSPPPLIDDLTSLFEEVKFSTHDISVQQVELAKSLATKIIIHCKSSSEAEIESDNEVDAETEIGERK
ncbi:MAG: DUF4129 domain-containing protein [Candidatus Hermodarchaeota archaeon]